MESEFSACFTWTLKQAPSRIPAALKTQERIRIGDIIFEGTILILPDAMPGGNSTWTFWPEAPKAGLDNNRLAL